MTSRRYGVILALSRGYKVWLKFWARVSIAWNSGHAIFARERTQKQNEFLDISFVVLLEWCLDAIGNKKVCHPLPPRLFIMASNGFKNLMYEAGILNYFKVCQCRRVEMLQKFDKKAWLIFLALSFEHQRFNQRRTMAPEQHPWPSTPNLYFRPLAGGSLVQLTYSWKIKRRITKKVVGKFVRSLFAVRHSRSGDLVTRAGAMWSLALGRCGHSRSGEKVVRK